MTNKVAGALAAGALAVGVLVGAAGTVLVHDATGPAMGMNGMTQMMEMMDGGRMGDGMMGDAPIDPAEHESHHGDDR
jgi:hypothetical protein